MYAENIDHKIAESLKEHNTVSLAVWRSIKTEFLNYKTAKAGNVLTDAVEITLINKLLSQRKDAAQQFRDGGRVDLAEKEEAEAEVLATLVPKEPTEKEIADAVKNFVEEKAEGYVLSMKDMKDVMAYVKGKYPNANGGLVSQIFRKLI